MVQSAARQGRSISIVHARAVSRETARVLTFFYPGGKPSQRRAKSEGRRKRDIALKAGEIVSRKPACEPANNQRTDVGAGEADPRPANKREQPPRELECLLVERAPREVIVKNDDSTVTFHERADLSEQISKIG